MYSLFIDCTQDDCYLAIFKNKTILLKRVVKTNKNLTDLIVENIGAMFLQLKLDTKLIKRIMVVIGPGSFTGIKVATTIAKAFNLINKTKIYVITSLLLQIKDSGISLIDAKNSYFYVAIYKYKKLVLKPCVVHIDKIKTLSKKYHIKEMVINNLKVNIFEQVIYHWNDFKLINGLANLKPLYIKEPV